MEWEFTPEQVVKADVAYGLSDFRDDLFREVAGNLSGAGAAEVEATFNLLFDLCYWQATGRAFDEFIAQYRHSPPVCEFLEGVRPAMAANVDMLGAVLQRLIMTEVENGTQLDDGLVNVDTSVRRMTATLPDCATS
jgi:hypothetical protein